MTMLEILFKGAEKGLEILNRANGYMDLIPALVETGAMAADKAVETFDAIHDKLNNVVDLPGGRDELEEALAKLDAQRAVIAEVRQKYAPDPPDA